MLKKILTILLAAALVAPVLIMPEGVTVKAAYNDIPADASYAEAVNMLTGFSIIQGSGSGAFSPGKTLTRGEFALMIGRILYDMPTALPDVSTFGDVKTGSELARVLSHLVHLGLFSGYDDAEFGPDDPVSSEQAAKVLVCLLGYNPQAEKIGGYPTGYTTQASILGIFRGVERSEELSRAAVARMICNALFVDIMQQRVYGAHSVTEIIAGETLLSNVMRITEERNRVVTANSRTRLAGGEGVREGMVEIGGVMFNEGKTGAGDMLGKRVRIFYRESDDGNPPMLLYVDAGSGNRLEISLEDVVSVAENEIRYRQNGREVKATVSPKSEMIYNGRAADYDPALIVPGAEGFLILEESGTTGYDIITVQAYTNVFTVSADYEKRIVYGKYGANDIYDFSSIRSENLVAVNTIDGAHMSFDTIGKNYLISVCVGADGDYAEIYINTRMIEGVITEVGDDYVVVGEESYKTAKYLSQSTFRAGDSGALYLDLAGRAAHFEKKSGGGLKYGLVMGVESASFGDVQLKMLTEDDEMKMMSLASSVSVNNKKEKRDAAAKSIKDALHDVASKWPVDPKKPRGELPQVVRYMANDDDAIVEIYTAIDPQDKISDRDLCIASLRTDRLAKMSGHDFDHKFAVRTNSSIIFMVPLTGTGPDEEYSAVRFNESVAGKLDNKRYDVEFYNVNKSMEAEVVLLWGNNPNSLVMPNNSTPILMVDKVTEVLNSKGEKTLKLYGIREGSRVEYIAAKPETLMKTAVGGGTVPLGRGDIIRIGRNAQGEISGIQLHMDNDVKARFNSNWSYNGMDSENWGLSGVVYAKEGEHIMVSNTMSEFVDSSLFSDLNALSVYHFLYSFMVYDEEHDEIRVGSEADILDYLTVGSKASRFFGQFRWCGMINMAIFKYK